MTEHKIMECTDSIYLANLESNYSMQWRENQKHIFISKFLATIYASNVFFVQN